MARTKIFVSYSHEDREWLETLNTHLAVLKRGQLWRIRIDLDAKNMVPNSWKLMVPG